MSGFSDAGISVGSVAEAEVKASVIERARRVVVPVDHSKVGATDFARICDLDDVDTVVMDAASPQIQQLCEQHEIELVVANRRLQGDRSAARRRARRGPIAQFAHFEALPQGAATPSCTRSATSPRTCSSGWPRSTGRARTFTDYDAMLADPEVDAVIVAIADQFHVAAGAPGARGRQARAGREAAGRRPSRSASALRDEVARERAGAAGRHDAALRPRHRASRATSSASELGELIALQGLVLRLDLPLHDDRHAAAADRAQPARTRAGRPATRRRDRRRYYLLGHGSHLVDTARFLGGRDRRASRRGSPRSAARYCWFVDVDFADGALGHLDLTMTRADGLARGLPGLRRARQRASAAAFQPWYQRASEVECFSATDRAVPPAARRGRPLLPPPGRGLRRHDPRPARRSRAPTSTTGSPRCAPWTRSRARSQTGATVTVDAGFAAA